MNNLIPKYTFNENAWITKLLYKPLLNVLMLLYVYIPGHDFGVAIIVLTLIIRAILFPSYLGTLRSQWALKKIQPKLDEIKKLHQDDKTKQSQEMMKIYKDHKVNPLGSCLPLIIQIPILFALYRVFSIGLTTDSLTHLYDWFPRVPEAINTTFLAFTHIPQLQVNLANPNMYLAITAAACQLLQSWLTTKFQPVQGEGMAKMINMQMLYLFPIMTGFIAWSLPAALALYWIATTVFTILQQLFVITPAGRRLVEK
ncbi:membrane protein insertase YidC [Patescibacteria group bacterium]|nr:membrane protein insertase YidC [Patescibacteria group bacterium]